MTMPHNSDNQLADAQIQAYRAQRIQALMAKPLFTDGEVAEILGIPLSSFLAFKKTLHLSQWKTGKRWFTSRTDLMAWIEKQAQAAREPF